MTTRTNKESTHILRGVMEIFRTKPNAAIHPKLTFEGGRGGSGVSNKFDTTGVMFVSSMKLYFVLLATAFYFC